MLKGIRSSISGMIRSIVGYRWAYADGGVIASGADSSVQDSVWSIGGVEHNAQSLSRLDIQFVDFKKQQVIQNPNREQQEWINLFYNPNPLTTTRQLFELTSMLYDIEGSCYWILLDISGNPIATPLEIPSQIMVFGNQVIKPKYSPNSSIVIGWEMRDGSNIRSLPNHAVVRFWKTNPWSYKEGLSLASKVGSSIALDKGARIVNRGFFNNGARPSGYVQASQKVGKTEFDIFVEQFRNIYGSKTNAGKVAALPHPFEFKPLNEVKDMDFKNLHEMTRDEQFAGTKTPKFIMGVNDNINFATAEVLDRNFWQSTIAHHSMMFADIINTRLLAGTGMKIEFSFEKIPIIAKDNIEVQKRKLALAAYLFNLGYPTNWINRKLNLGMDEINEPWANEPHDPTLSSPMAVPSDSASSSGASSEYAKSTNSEHRVDKSGSDVKKKIADAVGDAVADSIAKTISQFEKAEESEDEILSKAKAGDMDAQSKYCDIVERATTVPLVPAMQRTVESYFRRLEKSQIAKIMAFVQVDEFNEKAVRADEREIKVENVAQILFNQAKWNGVIIEDTKGYHLKAYKSGIARAKKELGGFSTFNESDAQAAEAAGKLTNKITRINDTIRSSVQNTMIESIKAGKTTPEIIEAVKAEFEMSQSRANMIARTEMGIAANNGRWDSMSAEVETKQWLTSEDGNVRESHRHFSEIGSQDISYSYAPGLKFPQDSGGAAEEVINCRCTIVKGN